MANVVLDSSKVSGPPKIASVWDASEQFQRPAEYVYCVLAKHAQHDDAVHGAEQSRANDDNAGLEIPRKLLREEQDGPNCRAESCVLLG